MYTDRAVDFILPPTPMPKGTSEPETATATGMAAAVLAGGLSTRLGEDKATVPFAGTTVLAWQCHRLRSQFPGVFVVAKDPGRFAELGVPVVADALPISASAVGVYTAVLASPTDRVLCLACDMPFVPEALLTALVRGSGDHDVFVPRHGERIEPLCAVYAKTVLGPLSEQLARGVKRIDEFYARVRTGYLDVQDHSFGDPAQIFLNLNTPQELDKARGLMAGPDQHDPRARMRSFVRRVPLPVVSFVGKKKSGKTSVVVRVIEELTRRGYRVAALKHHSHELEADTPHTDSYRMRQAGAVVAGLCGQKEYFQVAHASSALSLEDHVRRIREPVDLVITEGFKRQDAPKIEVSRRARSQELVCDEGELLAIVSDQEFPAYSVPRYHLGDAVAVARFIESWIREQWPRLRAGSAPPDEEVR